MSKIGLYIHPDATDFIQSNSEDSGYKVMFHENFVSPGDIIARVLNKDSEIEEAKKNNEFLAISEFGQINFEESIQFNEKSLVWTSNTFGFVKLNRNTGQLEIFPPVKIEEDHLKAWYVFPSKGTSKLPSSSVIINQAKSLEIHHLLSTKDILTQLSHQKEKNCLTILIAKGKAPVNGMTDHYDLLIKEEKSIGTLQLDGKMDYKDRKTFTMVPAGKPVLKHHPQIEPEDGYDIFGRILHSKTKVIGRFQPGDNLIPDSSDPNLIVSEIDGTLVINQEKVSVKPVIEINSNVDYETGHIEFSGSVHVKGAVLPGFHIIAGGDVIIEKEVEDATITAGGSVTVRLGITGTGKTEIKSGNQVSARFVMNSHIEAFGNVEVEESILNSTVLCDNSILVEGKHGSIIGGHCSALNEIRIKTAGSPQEIETRLEVGKSLKFDLEIRPVLALKADLKSQFKELEQEIVNLYGEEMLHPSRFQLAKMDPEHRESFLNIAKKIKDLRQRLKRLSIIKQQIERKFQMPPHPIIHAKDKIFPSVTLSILGDEIKITSTKEYTRFYLDNKTGKIIESSY